MRSLANTFILNLWDFTSGRYFAFTSPPPVSVFQRWRETACPLVIKRHDRGSSRVFTILQHRILLGAVLGEPTVEPSPSELETSPGVGAKAVASTWSPSGTMLIKRPH